MNLRKNIAVTLAAGAFLASSLLGASAAGVTSTTITVSGGEFTAYVESMDFESVPFSFDAQESDGELQLRTIDKSGDNGDWSVQFKMGGFGSNIPLSGYSFGDYEIETLDGMTNNGQTFTHASGTWSAPVNNSGDYRLSADGSMNVPAYTPAGTYTSTVQLDVVTGN